MDDFSFAALLKKMIEIDDAENFYKSSLRQINWNKPPGDIVIHRSMGFSNFVYHFSQLFPDIRKVINIDLLTMSDSEAEDKVTSEINIKKHAKKGRCKIQEKRNGLKALISLHGFRFEGGIRSKFQKLYEFLEDGEVAIIFLLTWSPYFHFLLELCDHPVWSAYMKYTKDSIPDYFKRLHKKSYYDAMLRETGFTIISCVEGYKCKSFSCDEECKDWIFSTIAFCVNLSSYMELMFREQAFEIYLKHIHRLNNGSPSLPYSYLRILVSKSKGSKNEKQ